MQSLFSGLHYVPSIARRRLTVGGLCSGAIWHPFSVKSPDTARPRIHLIIDGEFLVFVSVFCFCLFAESSLVVFCRIVVGDWTREMQRALNPQDIRGEVCICVVWVLVFFLCTDRTIAQLNVDRLPKIRIAGQFVVFVLDVEIVQ